jgi:hypothetical protein
MVLGLVISSDSGESRPVQNPMVGACGSYSMPLGKAWLAVALLVGLAEIAAAGELLEGNAGSVNEVKDTRALAARVDQVIAARWAEAGVRAAEEAEDGEFLRRVSLDLIGKIPTAAEARDFLDDPGRSKRRALVERLLDSPAYTTRATELWRQLLLPEADSEDLARQVAGGFEAWLRRKVSEDAGYDRIAREILTARLEGQNNGVLGGVTDSSPAAYYLAKQGKPESIAAGVTRVFLGVRLECAQCHDHPFARWKREQFWGFAAFFAGVPGQGNENEIPTTRTRESKPRRELTIPGTKKVVQASHLDGSAPSWGPRAESREILADWITASGNRYFARAIVNRVWARFFGVGLVEPIDDLDLEADPEFGGLLDELAVQFRLHGYDIKYLIRVFTATRSYNLSSRSGSSESVVPMFGAMPVRGLSAGQLFDSLVRATGQDAFAARPRFLELFVDRQGRPTEAQTTILQALAMMNGMFMSGATSRESGEVLGAVASSPFLDTPGRIETLYLATLSRRPKPGELSMLVQYVERQPEAASRERALADVFWAILNGPEFTLNH